MNDFLIGQRVIVSGREIATVIPTPSGFKDPCDNYVWVRLGSGIEQFRDKQGVKPLPGGQL